MANLVVFDGV